MEQRGAPQEDVYAHSLEGRPKEEWQGLRQHLEGVAALARRFAEAFASGPWGWLAGLWHDVGKSRPPFQAYIDEGSSQASGGDHAIGGALLARRSEGLASQQLPLAFVIAGHHAGLANLAADPVPRPRPLESRLEENAAQLPELLASVPGDLVNQPLPELPAFLRQRPASKAEVEHLRLRAELWTRFLFSALVDGDRLDTEAFYDPSTAGERGRGFLSVGELRRRVDDHIDALSARAPATVVNRRRGRILEACRRAAKEPPGLFSLTVPTGGGKTLSALSFALRHGQAHQLRRVVTVIPYTSIIEQNAKVYRRAVQREGEREQVIEHHSNLDPEEEESRGVEALRRRWAAENWDAPLIVTTTVQLFESLFSNRPGRCRKLHNLARSVLILDEVQSLPAHLLRTILDGLQALVEDYGCTVVLCTATQPALARRPGFPGGLVGVREMVGDPGGLARGLRRFRAELPAPEEEAVSWEELAGRVAEHPQTLAVVHRRQDAQDLVRALEDPGEEGSLFHLSASMCAAHRSVVLARVRETLRRGRPCRLVSTQLIEAGVDVDFPVVFRALAGLDSLVQAAGRCNREGSLPEGRFIVFRAPTKPPPGILQRGLEQMESLLLELGTELELTDPELVERYFRRLYAVTDPDSKSLQSERSQFNFHTVARKFRLIEDGYSEPVAIPYGDEGEARIQRLRREGPSLRALRALQPYVVQVPRWRLDPWRQQGIVEALTDTISTLTYPYRHVYHRHYGLLLEEAPTPDHGALVI